MRKLYAVFLIAVSVTFISCSNDENISESGPMTIEFDNVVGATNLQLNTSGAPYTNSRGEAYKLTWLTYYVSNIKLKKTDGTIFQDPIKSDGSAGYYLVDENDAESQEITLENVPAGEYTEITFTIGVDASQVDQGAQTGDLDPSKGLFWSWNTGYIFMALEGMSPASNEPGNVFQYHVGGYKEDAASNQVNNIKTVTLSFNGDAAPVRAEHKPEVHLLFDVNKFLNGSGEQVTFTSTASRHSPMPCKNLANNITSAFVVDHIHAN
jgi:hypothetical protein